MNNQVWKFEYIDGKTNWWVTIGFWTIAIAASVAVLVAFI